MAINILCLIKSIFYTNYAKDDIVINKLAIYDNFNGIIKFALCGS